jgi:hypothetical protein
MALNRQNFQTILLPVSPVFIRNLRKPDTQPLPRHRVPVLHTRETDIPTFHAADSRQAARNVLSIEAAFFDSKEKMFALA